MIISEPKKFYATFRTALVFLAFAETLSFFAFLYPSFSSAAFVIISLLTLGLALISFETAVLVLLGELFIGSQGGYLFAYGTGQGIDISIRLGLFLMVVGTWAAKICADFMDKKRRPNALAWQRSLASRGLWKPYSAIIGTVSMGILGGILRGNDLGNVFFDANGYLFFGLLPALLVGLSSKQVRERVLAVLMAGLTASITKALIVLFVFSHRMLATAPFVYVWVRDTRVGEITRMVGDFYRVFFQSHLFALVVFFVTLVVLTHFDPAKKPSKNLLAAAIMGLIGVLMGFSRSFWFGGFMATSMLMIVWIRSGSAAIVYRRFFGWGVLMTVSIIAGLALLYAFPFPQKGAEVSFSSLFSGRAFSLSGEAAVSSRWALLPKLNEAVMRHPILGNGLGATVTYTTSDPRLLAGNPSGAYTTFAFEWGYHDLVVKFGFLGFTAYLWLIYAIMKPLIRTIWKNRKLLKTPGSSASQDQVVFTLGVFAALCAFLGTNLFSPYLNHPLGIGLLLLIAVFGIHGEFDVQTPESDAPMISL